MKSGVNDMQTGQPNILFLMTDQQRPDSLGCYGNPVARTPNLDQLAERGVVFNNCYVQNPLCCPSRYSILTGRYSHNHRVRSNWYKPQEGEQSFGHRLKTVGYRSALIGKMHFTPWNDLFGFDGRVIAESKFHTNCPDDYARFLRRHGLGRADLYDQKSPAYVQSCTAVKSRVPQELHIDSFVGRGIIEYLRNARGPFVLFGSFPSPHNPYDPPAPYDELFLDVALPPRNMTPGEVERKPREVYEYINNRLKWPFRTDELTEQQLQLSRAYYYSLCTFVDDWVGRIVDVLKETGLYENTIIVYTSDHGDLLGDHGIVYKQSFYEQSVRVPLIVHAPSRFEPRRVNDLVESIDLFATFCELGGAWPGEGQQGKSLLPLLEGRNGVLHREAVFSESSFSRMVRMGEHKLVYYPGRPYGELYNLTDDPEEQRNLWDDPGAQVVKRELKDVLLDWAFSSEDPLPLPIRSDHFDESPRDQRSLDGRAVESERQSWYIQDMLGLYEGWEFSENGVLR